MNVENLMQMRSEAKNTYTWLWWSFLLTFPTFWFVYSTNIGYGLVCSGGRSACNWVFADQATGVLAILVSAGWHVFFLKKAFGGAAEPFTRWHARQALFLAGIRTVIPLYYVIFLSPTFNTGAILFAVWLLGTLWGQNQVERWDCWLMRRRGMGTELEELAERERMLLLEPQWWIHQLLHHKKANERKKAAIMLGKLEEGSEEVFKALQQARYDKDYNVRDAVRNALQSPVFQRYDIPKEAPQTVAAQPVEGPISSPEEAYHRGVKLLSAGLNQESRKKAVAKFTLAFREGNALIRQLAIAELEKLGEVEVF